MRLCYWGNIGTVAVDVVVHQSVGWRLEANQRCCPVKRVTVQYFGTIEEDDDDE